MACSNHRIVADTGAGFSKENEVFLALFLSVVKSAWLLAAMCICAALLALQIIIFCWAPVNGQSRSLALVCFLLSLVMVITGRALYGEMMSGLQKIAVLLAACGVTAEVFMVRSLPLVALVVMLGYPPYFIIKRQLKSDAFFSVIAENLFLMIPAVVLLIYQGSGNEWLPTGGWRTVTGLGLRSCSALLCFCLPAAVSLLRCLACCHMSNPCCYFWYHFFCREKNCLCHHC
ncbi:hypothetical protein NHB29_21310 (plasmid) [Pantoea agglomerans]|uniref:hypothetical protein n=1 Tax=Enterobacter agglomerans TaxID=549 RepID=UPI00273A5AF2|nr:hypothetical protein [Pantoea agglomerans]WLO87092.1 hypothetical protein NHB29_21310 [Pantoea agglomerans]